MRSAPTDTSIRRLTLQDIPSLMVLSGAAGWNQTAADWAVLIGLHPEGCLGIEKSGAIVSSATLTCYEDQIAWLGMVLTHPEHRKRGFATHLVESALTIASDKRIRAVKLDATDLGAPLYEKLGFREEQPIERWFGPGGVAPETFMPGMLNFQLDHEAFGADRSALLRTLAANNPPFTTKDGFVMWRLGARATYLGPCVARSPEMARRLIGNALFSAAGPWFWDLLPCNDAATAIAEDLGFQVARKLLRMVKGDNIRGKESIIYAAGGFEIG